MANTFIWPYDFGAHGWLYSYPFCIWKEWWHLCFKVMFEGDILLMVQISSDDVFWNLVNSGRSTTQLPLSGLNFPDFWTINSMAYSIQTTEQTSRRRVVASALRNEITGRKKKRPAVGWSYFFVTVVSACRLDFLYVLCMLCVCFCFEGRVKGYSQKVMSHVW